MLPPHCAEAHGTQAGRKAHHDFTPDTEQWTPSCPGRDSGRVPLIQVTSTLPRAGAPPQPQGPPHQESPGHSEPRPLLTRSAVPTPREVVLCSLVNQRCVFLRRLQAGPHSPLLTSSHKYAGAGLPHRRWGNPANKPDLPCGSHIWRERQTINRKTKTCKTCQGRAEAWTPAPPPRRIRTLRTLTCRGDTCPGRTREPAGPWLPRPPGLVRAPHTCPSAQRRPQSSPKHVWLSFQLPGEN